jgi:hypothetical protein
MDKKYKMERNDQTETRRKIFDFIVWKYKYKIDPNDQRLIGWKDKIRWLNMKRTGNKITIY